MTRRDLILRFGTMTAAAIALPIDIDQLIWTPKPIITVPALPTVFTHTAKGFGYELIVYYDLKGDVQGEWWKSQPPPGVGGSFPVVCSYRHGR